MWQFHVWLEQPSPSGGKGVPGGITICGISSIDFIISKDRLLSQEQADLLKIIPENACIRCFDKEIKAGGK